MRPADSSSTDSSSIAPTTKSRGTRHTRTLSASPTAGTTAMEGWRARKVARKYGPSYFWVAPVCESPTTMPGR